MTHKVLILCKNDRWHPFEELGHQILEWTEGIEGIQMEIAHEREKLTPENLDPYDLCILCMNMRGLTSAQEEALVDFVAGGKVFFGIHAASVVEEERHRYIELLGGRFTHHSPYHEFEVLIEDPTHPITRGLTNFRITDELYVLDRTPVHAQILASAIWEDRPQPLLYTKNYGQGRVLYNALGHNQRVYAHPVFQQLVVRGIQWAFSLIG